MFGDNLFGGDKATVHIHGIKNPLYTLNLPKSLLKELRDKGVELKHLQIVKVWIEPTKSEAKTKPYAFKPKEIAETSAENENP